MAQWSWFEKNTLRPLPKPQRKATRFINKCVQFELAGKVGKDNKPTDGVYIDSQSLKITKRGIEGKEIDKLKAADKIKKEEDTMLEYTGGPNHKHIKMAGH